MSGAAVFEESYIESKKAMYIKFLGQLGDKIDFNENKWVCSKRIRYPAEPLGNVTIRFNRIPESYMEITKYFILICLVNGKTISSAISHIYNLKRFFNFILKQKGGMNIDKCNVFVSAELVRYLDELGYADSTKRGVWSSVSTFFSTMKGWNNAYWKNPFTINPFASDRKYDAKYIPENIASKLDRLFMKDEIPLHIRCAYWLLRLIPSRISEIIGIRLDCLKRYNGNYVLFIPSWKQNNGRKEPLMRSIHLEDTEMSGYLIALIKAQQEASDGYQHYLSVNKKDMLFSFQHQGLRKGKVLMFNLYSVASRIVILKAFQRICIQYNILDASGQVYNLTTHQFRHNGITDRLAAGFTTAQIADMTGHHGDAMIFNAYTHLILLPETIIQKQEYISGESGSRDNKYVLFGGRILNMEEQLENRLLKNIRAHRVRGGICSDITGCKSDMWNCLDCGFFVPDADQLGYYEEQVALWREKSDRFSKFPIIRGNAEKNVELFKRIVEKLKEGGYQI